MTRSQPDPSDWDLIQRSRRGDPEAYGQLYERYLPRVQASARKGLGRHWGQDAAVVEQLAHEVLASLWDHDRRWLHAYDPTRSCFATFLSLRTRKVIQDHIQQRLTLQTWEKPLADWDGPEPRPRLLAEGLLLEELAASLTRCERAYFEACLFGNEAALKALSPANVRGAGEDIGGGVAFTRVRLCCPGHTEEHGCPPYGAADRERGAYWYFT